MTSSQLSTGTGSILAAMTVLMALTQVCQGQNYHFSNGWYAGKKRSSPSSTPAILGLVPNFGATHRGSSSSSIGSNGGVGSSSSLHNNMAGLLNFDVDDWRQMDSTACGARLQTLAVIRKLLQVSVFTECHNCDGVHSSTSVLFKQT